MGRSVEFGGERLLYHHYSGDVSATSPRALGLPKVLATDGDRLFLRPWKGLDALWERPLTPLAWSAPDTGPLSAGTWTIEANGVRGRSTLGGAACIAATGARDLDIEVRLRIVSGERAGVALGLDASRASGLLVLLDAARNRVTLGHFGAGMYGPVLDRTFDVVHRPIERERSYRLRVLARDRYAEVFLDDEVLFSTITGHIRPGGDLACVVDSAEALFQVERAHAIRPLSAERNV